MTNNYKYGLKGTQKQTPITNKHTLLYYCPIGTMSVRSVPTLQTLFYLHDSCVALAFPKTTTLLNKLYMEICCQ